MIPYGRQHISEADIAAVEDVLRSDFLTQGPTVPRFEQTVADYCGASHAVAANSATSALHIACLALNLKPGDLLWTAPNSFVASANCARYCGADVDFVDIDPTTYNMSVAALGAKLAHAEQDGRLPDIVVPVHFAGLPCDMPAIHALSRRFHFKIIEDASHAIGSSYAGAGGGGESSGARKVGCGAFSDVTVFSFHPVKIITAGEGGMALTNNNETANRMRRLRTHGITNQKSLMQARPDEEIWNYQQIELGFNYRMSDIHAALGLSQMCRLDENISRRHDVAKHYHRKLADLPITTPWQPPQSYSSYHLYPIRVSESESRKTQRQVYDALWQSGIAANLHYIPIHRHPYYENLGFKIGDFPEAERFHREVISLPMYSTLNATKQEAVLVALENALAT